MRQMHSKGSGNERIMTGEERQTGNNTQEGEWEGTVQRERARENRGLEGEREREEEGRGSSIQTTVKTGSPKS